MDKAQLGLILKVFVYSLGLSIIIKYGGPFLSFAPTNLNALIAISLLPLVVFLMLIWRYRSSNNLSKTQ